MTELLVSEAVALVRKNLDEVGLNESLMYSDENSDNESLDLTIKRTLPEAINEVHSFVPVETLEGVEVSTLSSCEITDRVLSFSFENPFLRLVAFQAKDSGIVVTEVIPETSVEAHKQLNKYVRGTFDKPRLVQIQGEHKQPAFRYYTLSKDEYATEPSSAIKRLTIVEELFYEPERESYPISTDLRQTIIDQLTGLVLAIYKDGDKAQYFLQRAKLN